MGFNVNLTIRGLCAFVPSEPLLFEPGRPPQRIGGMTVLIMDARQPRIIPNRDRNNPPINLEVCAHLPLLRYPQAGKKVSDFLILDGRRIEISGVDRPDPKSLEIAPSFEKWVSMEKVLDLSPSNPGPARVDPKFLDSILPAGLVGRLDLIAGTVEAKKSVGVWEFLPPPVGKSAYRDRLESEVQVSIPIDADRATLRLVGRGDLIERVLEPKRVGPTDSASVELLLSNVCFDEAEPGRPRVEEDFAVFYDLLTGYNGVLRVPHVVGNQGGGGGQGTVQGAATVSPGCVGMRAAAS